MRSLAWHVLVVRLLSNKGDEERQDNENEKEQDTDNRRSDDPHRNVDRFWIGNTNERAPPIDKRLHLGFTHERTYR